MDPAEPSTNGPPSAARVTTDAKPPFEMKNRAQSYHNVETAVEDFLPPPRRWGRSPIPVIPVILSTFYSGADTFA